MFTFRYHLVSLAAVFIALAVGTLLGAAISGKLGDAEDALTKDRIDSLNEQLSQERARTANAERSNEATRQVLEDAYPALMDERLAGRGYAVLFLGPVDGDALPSSGRLPTPTREARYGSSVSTRPSTRRPSTTP